MANYLENNHLQLIMYLKMFQKGFEHVIYCPLNSGSNLGSAAGPED